MPRHRLVAPTVAALVVAAGIPTAPATAAAVQPPAASAKPAELAAAPKVLKFGQAAKIAGEKGSPLKVAPVGVYYHKPSQAHFAQPREKWFVAIAFRVTAGSKPDRVPPPISGSQWRIKIGSRAFTTSSGKALESPWVGRTDGQEITIQAGSSEVIYYSFDLPRTGGTLEWSTPNGVTRWKIPTATYGKADVLKPIRDAIADYEGA
ncbi:hypothetical protein [Nonomuraea recticatena]|uniref:Uncharacterized protein n=1 Tax=Nonomuraea recticatena TaxID=46178 RepID=A0ABP6FGR1_9ACTN